ncbi:hypothetical protein FA15DRAFT_658094 [Coprinopsis marcescibilis]|uniref:Uncharacterized protein n=1 Tax=Coprinopsis marcescibilis TaxID=230819 RepID=A0A5C3KNA2_COPMA|nr:hypothetical protein FA15DRAFT_658094 [Coprinopsis marcescibilis]
MCLNITLGRRLLFKVNSTRTIVSLETRGDINQTQHIGRKSTRLPNDAVMISFDASSSLGTTPIEPRAWKVLLREEVPHERKILRVALTSIGVLETQKATGVILAIEVPALPVLEYDSGKREAVKYNSQGFAIPAITGHIILALKSQWLPAMDSEEVVECLKCPILVDGVISARESSSLVLGLTAVQTSVGEVEGSIIAEMEDALLEEITKLEA